MNSLLHKKITNKTQNNVSNYSIEWKKLHAFNDTHTIWKLLLSALVIRGVIQHKKTIESVMTDFEIDSQTFFPHQIIPYVYKTLYPLHRKGIKALSHQTCRYWFSIDNSEKQSNFSFPNKNEISPLFFDILKVSIIAQLYEQDKAFMWGNETIELIKALFPKLEKVATVYLRTIQRHLENPAIPKPLGDAQYFNQRMLPDLPQWWQKSTKPATFQALRKALGSHPQLFLRMNPIYLQNRYQNNNENNVNIKGNVNSFIQQFINTYNEQKKPEHQSLQICPNNSYTVMAIKDEEGKSTKAPNVRHIPDFIEQGSCSVQDLSAQYLRIWIEKMQKHQDSQGIQKTSLLGKVLEIGTAPGGKLGLILEQWFLNPDLCEHIIAIDNDAYRMEKVTELMKRLNIPNDLLEKVELTHADATTYKINDHSNIDSNANTIIIDAPCSASGVIRKHPEIALNRQPIDVEELVILQKNILDAQWNNLAHQGYLLYMTCSVFEAENQSQMKEFLKNHGDAELIDDEQLLPVTILNNNSNSSKEHKIENEAQSEGFYYALLYKTM